MKNKLISKKFHESKKQLRKTPSSPLINIIKLPHLPQASSPQLTHRFFTTFEEDYKNSKQDRKPTQSLYSFPLSKQSSELIIHRKLQDPSGKSEVKATYTPSQEEKDSPKKKAEEAINFIKAQEEIPEERSSSCYDEKEKCSTLEDYASERVAGSTSISFKNEINESHLSPGNVRPSENSSRQKTRKPDQNFQGANFSIEEVMQLRKALEKETKKYNELEERYNTVLQEKISDSVVLKTLENKSIESDKALKLNAALKGQIEEIKDKMQIELTKCQKSIAEHREELKIKNIELEQTQSILLKTDAQRRRFAETIKLLEDEIGRLKQDNSNLNLLLEEKQKEANSYMQLLIEGNDKLIQFEKTNKDLVNLQEIQVKVTALHEENVSLQKEASRMGQLFSLSKNKWRDKKHKLKDLILELSSKIEQESSISVKISDEFKSKRSFSIRDANHTASINKETILKLQSKVYDLEASLTGSRTENEKLLKSIEYLKGKSEDKAKVIDVLEDKINRFENVEALNRTYKETEKVIQKIEKCAGNIFDEITCGKCKSANVAEYLMIPCEHIVCSQCMNFEECCIMCRNPARVYNFEAFLSIYNKVRQQLDLISSIRHSNSRFSI